MLADFAVVEFGLGAATSAVLTIAGIKLRDRNSAINALEGVKSELIENRETASTIIEDLAEDIKSDQVGEARLSRSTLKFRTSAYDNFIDSGYIGILSDELQEQLRAHYDEVRILNAELGDRGKREIGSSDDGSVSPGFDDGGTLLDMLVICSEEHRREILEDMEDNPVNRSLAMLQSLLKAGIMEESNTAKRDNIDFDTIHRAVEDDLDGRLLNF